MRFVRLASTIGLALSIAGGVAVVACGGEEDPVLRPGSLDATFDAPLVGDAAPATQVDAEPAPGEVCGDKAGLMASSLWPLRGGCPTRAGWSSSAGPQAGTLSWSVTLPTTESSPAVIGGQASLAWIGVSDGLVLAVGNGGVRWAYRTGGAVKASAAMDTNGIAVIGSTDGVLYGITPGDTSSVPIDAGADGGPSYPSAKLAFAYAVGPMASSPVIGTDGTIYVGTLDGKLVAVAASHTSTKWTVTTNDTFGSSPALGQDGTIYVGSSDHKLYAILRDGATKWSLDLGAEIHASPAVGGDGTIYIGTVDGKLHAVETGGVLRWSYPTGGAITETVAVYAGTVYVGSADKKLHAVSTVGGSRRWAYETLGAVATPLVSSDGIVYAGSADGHLYAITPKGNLFFATNVKGKVRGAPAFTMGPSLFIVTDKGVVGVGP